MPHKKILCALLICVISLLITPVTAGTVIVEHPDDQTTVITIFEYKDSDEKAYDEALARVQKAYQDGELSDEDISKAIQKALGVDASVVQRARESWNNPPATPTTTPTSPAPEASLIIAFGIVVTVLIFRRS